MIEELTKKIEGKGAEIRAAKEAKASKEQIQPLVEALLKLKADYKAETGSDYGPPKEEKKKKEPKGPTQQESTRDGPSKKELNKLAKKEARKGAKEANKGDDTRTARSTAQKVVISASGKSTSTLSSKSDSLRIFISESGQGCDLTKSVINFIGGAASKIVFETSIDAKDCEPCLIGGGSSSISGDMNICRFVVRAFAPALYWSLDAWGASQVDQWLDLYATADPIALLSLVEDHLADKTFMVGGSFSLADIAISLIATKKRGALPNRANIERWFALTKATMESCTPSSSSSSSSSSGAEAGASGGKKGEKAQAASADAQTDTNPPLEGAVDGKVVTRFPPEPSGYLHIGHVKACLLNEYYAKRYHGKLILRFDDTNPSKEKEEYQDNIIADLATIKVFPDKVSFTSDYFKQCQEVAIQMIKDGLAYMDDTDQEVMKAERMAMQESKYRNMTVDENLVLFDNMCSGNPEFKDWCMRGKIDMASKNGTMRDPVLFRSNEAPHHRTGTKYKAYPTYDFACPLVDSLEGVTHALRTTEYDDRNVMYEWMQKAMKLKHKTSIKTFGKMNFIHTVLSKRKLNWFVENKIVEGWFDPRFPTIQGTIRRGVDVDALKSFVVSQGASRRVITMEWDKFWSDNKMVLEQKAPRYMGVNTPGHVAVTLENVVAEITAHSVPLFPVQPERGSRVCRRYNVVYVDQSDAAALKEGEEVTFLRWGNMRITAIEKDGDTVRTMRATHDPQATNFSKTKKMTWLAAVPDCVECTLVSYDHLISKAKLDDGDSFQDFITQQSKVESSALCDPCLRNVNAGEVIQLERKGFFRVDKAYGGPGKPAILFAIPDGRTKGGSAVEKAAKSAKK